MELQVGPTPVAHTPGGPVTPCCPAPAAPCTQLASKVDRLAGGCNSVRADRVPHSGGEDHLPRLAAPHAARVPIAVMRFEFERWCLVLHSPCPSHPRAAHSLCRVTLGRALQPLAASSSLAPSPPCLALTHARVRSFQKWQALQLPARPVTVPL